MEIMMEPGTEMEMEVEVGAETEQARNAERKESAAETVQRQTLKAADLSSAETAGPGSCSWPEFFKTLEGQQLCRALLSTSSRGLGRSEERDMPGQKGLCKKQGWRKEEEGGRRKGLSQKGQPESRMEET
eukprot:1555618-Rhodomonas_salina.2